MAYITMDVAPATTIVTRTQFRRADQRAGLDLLLRQVAADLLNAPDRRNL